MSQDKDYELTKTWGHSRYKDAMQLALEADVKEFGLVHHNQERSDKELDDMVIDCKLIAKEAGSKMKCFGAYEGMEITL